MKTRILISILWLFSAIGIARAQYFQQEVDYDILVTLDTAGKSIRGEMTMTYHNHSPKPLSEIRMHLWANAYQSKKSFFAKQNLASNNDKFYWADEEHMGGYEELSFSQNGTELDWDHPRNNKEYVALSLHEPLPSGGSAEIKISFTQKVPFIYSRGGWAPGFYALTQWYPKAAVYDQKGWHLFPYLEMGEYFSEYGNYSVTIDVPDSSLVAATGIVRDSVVENGRLRKTYEAEEVLDFAWFYGENMIQEHKTITLDDGHKVDLQYYAPKNYALNKAKVADTLVPQREGVINNNLAPIEMLERSVRYYSDQVAPYPYPQATVVIGPLNTGSGMEYPMITLIGPTQSKQSLDRVIAHEIGHNWFQGILGFDERSFPYLDEGINSFYENKYMDDHYGSSNMKFQVMAARTALNFDQFLYQSAYQRGDIVPVNSHTHDMDLIQYYFNAYMLPPTLFDKLEEAVGPEQFRANMEIFYDRYRFKHPTAENLRQVFEENAKEAMSFDWFFDDLLNTVKPYDIAITEVVSQGREYRVTLENRGEITAPFAIKGYRGKKAIHTARFPAFEGKTTVTLPMEDYDYIAVDENLGVERSPENNRHDFIPVRKQKFINPVFGLKNPGIAKIWYYPLVNFNYADGFIFGAGLHNITLPGNNLEFFVQPGFGIKSNEWVGMAGMDYYIPRNNSRIRYFNIGWSAKHYSQGLRDIPGPDDHQPPMYWRFNPRFKISFQPQNKFNPWYNTLKITAPVVGSPDHFLTDEFGNFSHFETVWRVYPRAHFRMKRNSPVNNIEMNFKAEFLSQKGGQDKKENFLKTTAELITDYAYASKQKIYARFFVGAFPVNTISQSGIVPNSPFSGMLGVSYQGYHDYAYDGYFTDRAESSGKIWGRQISTEDGGFKDALGAANAMLTGNSNSFLAAINLNADLPVIGKKFPLKPYADFAIYDKAPYGSGTAFLFSGGVMLGRDKWPVSLYLPLFGSREIMDIHKERGKLWSRISFRLSLEDWGLSEKLRDTPTSQLGILQ